MKMFRAPIVIIFFTFFAVAASQAETITLEELSESADVQTGFVDILYDRKLGQTYLKIKNLGSEFIYQTSLPNGLGSNDIGLDRGQLGNTSLVLFERAGNKIFLKQKPTRYRAVSDNKTESASVAEAFASSILWGFDLLDSGDDWVLVDASDFILQDVHGVSRRLTQRKQGKGYAVDVSRSGVDLTRTKAFVDNTELQATITLVGDEPGNFVRETVPNPYAITLKMRHSFVRLPDNGYRTRTFIPKSGYWAIGYRDYAQPINSSIDVKLIPRHRLAKKDPTAAVSEAVEPIIYYLDPGVPEPIKSALLDGARI